MTDQEFYWDWLKHEDNLFTSRGNFFLVVESAFLAGAIAAISSRGSSLDTDLFLSLSAVGILVSMIWMFSSLKQIFTTEKRIKEKLASVDPRWKEISESRSNWPKIHYLMGIFLPAVFSIAWVYLTYLMTCIS